MTSALIVFMKNPALGKVKTRLAYTLGDEEALSIYHRLLDHTRSVTNKLSMDLIIYYTDYVDLNDGWDSTTKFLQCSGDLGQKMAQAFKEQLSKYDQVCGIGTDCAELSQQHLGEAFNILETSDFVIGPANDGGYYLLGMNKFEPSIFEGIEWSTSAVLSQTINKLESKEASYSLLPELIDVDTIEDWEKVLDKFQE